MAYHKRTGGISKAGYFVNIEQRTLENNHIREVLFIGEHTQLVVMTLKPGEEIGVETHDDIDQFTRVEGGEGVAVLDGEEIPLEDGSAVVIPAGTRHNVIIHADQPLRLYTLYSPPEHPDGTIHRTKKEADEAEHHH